VKNVKEAHSLEQDNKIRDEWWEPSSLVHSEKSIKEITDIKEIDLRNDFGSYRHVILTGNIESAELKLHNDVTPEAKVAMLGKIIRTKNPSSILDVGCGMGYTTGALAKKYPNAEVLGVDVSSDAIEFASIKHRQAQFIATAVTPGVTALGRFDLIYCFEFYPFTRNVDIEKQSAFIKHFSEQLTSQGELVIYQKWNNPLSLSAILGDVQKKCVNFKFTLVPIPHHKIYKVLPSLKLAIFISTSLNKILKKNWITNILIITHKT